MSQQQIPFAPSAGFLAEVMPPRIVCRECGLELLPRLRTCPSCGLERARYAGEIYPSGRMERFVWIFDQEIRDHNAFVVLQSLIYFDWPGGQIFPSVKRLAETARLSERATRNALRWLERHGWVVVEQRRRRGRQTSNRYIIQQAEMVAGSKDVLPARDAA